MRWTYLIPRLIIVLSVWAGLRFGLDPLLRYSLVQSAQTVTGAKADVGEVTSKLFPPRIQVAQVALASADRAGMNIVQFDSMEFRLSGDPLLRRQFVVEEGRVTGVRFDTPRSDDGQLPPQPEEEPSEPSWLAEKLKDQGREWLNGFADQLKAQLDPNVLETYRTGDEIYHKWDARFDQISGEVRAMKPRLENLQVQFKAAKQGNTLEQIEKYLQVAQNAESLALDAQKLQQRMQEIAPEVRVDLMRLDQARKNDTAQIQHLVRDFRPNAGDVTEAMIGEPMYEQLEQLLSWVQTVRSYAGQLQQQTHPERSRGTDFEFPWLHPTPDFHLRKLEVTGDFRIDGEWVPFEAVITDVTEDAPLLQRPAVVRFKLQGRHPLMVRVVHDATGPTTFTDLTAAYQELDQRPLTTQAGKYVSVCTSLADIR
ncbi:MAG: TIGR03545 family protein, partial [Planctomycetaceae bacterium]|nr:TIGR03545 family protein [Planctomycetaceae bacterium]